MDHVSTFARRAAGAVSAIHLGRAKRACGGIAPEALACHRGAMGACDPADGPGEGSASGAAERQGQAGPVSELLR